MSNNYLTVNDQTPSRPRKTPRSQVHDSQNVGPSPVRKYSEDLTQESPEPFDSISQKGTPAKTRSTRPRHQSVTSIDPRTLASLQKEDLRYIYETPINHPSAFRSETPDSRRQRADSQDGHSQNSGRQGHCADPLCRMQKDMYTTLLMSVYGARAHCSCRHLPSDQLASHSHGHRHRHRHSVTSQSPRESGHTTELNVPQERAQRLRRKVHESDPNDLHDPRQTRRDDATQTGSNLSAAGASAATSETRPLPPPTPRKPRIYLDPEDKCVHFRSDPSIIPGQVSQLRSAAPSDTTTRVQTSTIPPGPSPVLGNVPLSRSIAPASGSTGSTNGEPRRLPDPVRSANAPGSKAPGYPIVNNAFSSPRIASTGRTFQEQFKKLGAMVLPNSLARDAAPSQSASKAASNPADAQIRRSSSQTRESDSAVLTQIEDQLAAKRMHAHAFRLELPPYGALGGAPVPQGRAGGHGIWPGPNEDLPNNITPSPDDVQAPPQPLARGQQQAQGRPPAHQANVDQPSGPLKGALALPALGRVLLNISQENLHLIPNGRAPAQVMGTSSTTLAHKDTQYRILGALGAGSYGDVFCAAESRTRLDGGNDGSSALGPSVGEERPVAVKVIHKEKLYHLSNGREWILNEINMMRLATTGGRKWLVGLERAWSDEYDVFLAMNLYASTLSAWIVKSSPAWFPFRTYAAEMILMLCDLHDSGMIHRDIKPTNILVGLDGHLALGDFGFTVLREQPAKIGYGGTPHYCPPELYAEYPEKDTGVDAGEDRQARELACITETYDVWSMGACVLETYARTQMPVVGDLCILGVPFHEYMLNTNCEELPIMHYLENHNPTLWDLVRKMMARDPLDRWHPHALKTHPFFDGVNWEDLENKTRLPHCPPPPMPDPTHKNPHFQAKWNPLGDLCFKPQVIRAMLDDAKRDSDVFEWCAELAETV